MIPVRAAGALADEADRVSTAAWGALPLSPVQLDFLGRRCGPSRV
ncbi:hypothetical protein OHA79_37090 [Streptomyces sp. NBC_00841]|nr:MULTISPECIES: hypothetical protein [unclassified Streptomyces]MCX4531454.1 hypothetical protein [Streptomyces sp. NBC_01669]WSA02968.1 hypothetical protein OHA79_37090 [Streptomyces sp. NBC_00841]